MVVLTAKTMFPLLIILPNLEVTLCWMEFDLTIIATPIPPDPMTMPLPLNTVWEVIVILKCPQLTQTLVLNFPEVTLQGHNP